MEKGISYQTKMLLNYLPQEEIQMLLESVRNRNTEDKDFAKDLEEFSSKRSLDDYMILRSYTGYNFRSINAVLRRNWNYEENGLLTEKQQNRFLKDARDISNLVEEFPSPKKDFLTFRGTTLREFQKYGITSLEELKSLQGNYLYEEGFTSTSLKPESSYYGKNINGVDYNIEVVYHIPGESNDGIPLITEDLSYSKEQHEYLLNCRTLSYVEEVRVEGNTAHIHVIMIPKKVWNKSSEKEEKRNPNQL